MPQTRKIPDQGTEFALHDRIQAPGRFVEDEQVRVVHERLHDADLLPVSARQRADPYGQVEIEPLGQQVDPFPLHSAVQGREVAQVLAAGEIGVGHEVARQVADPALDRVVLVGSVSTQRWTAVACSARVRVCGAMLNMASANDRERALGVVQHALADRTEQQAGEAATATGADHDEVGRPGPSHERLCC